MLGKDADHLQQHARGKARVDRLAKKLKSTTNANLATVVIRVEPGMTDTEINELSIEKWRRENPGEDLADRTLIVVRLVGPA